MATLFVGQNKVYLPVTESTNSYAIGLLKNVNTHEGTVVYTDYQTQGRGQRGNSWKADSAMNIMLSVMLRPQFLDAKKSFCLSKITALAVYDVLAEISAISQFGIKIKWPNDILVNRQKVAGILIENSFKENALQWSVIGVGLNVNQDDFEGLPGASSLLRLTGREWPREQLMERLFVHLEKWYLALRNQKLGSINSAYMERLFGVNESNLFEENGKQFMAKMVNVTEAGLLELELEDRSRRLFDIKEVKLIL